MMFLTRQEGKEEEPRYLVIKRKDDKHSGRTVKWELRRAFDLWHDAERFVAYHAEEDFEILSLTITSVRRPNHPFNFFAGKANGKMPSFVRNRLKRIHKEAVEDAKSWRALAKGANPNRFEISKIMLGVKNKIKAWT